MRISSSILYSPCPCGSGKKFKFCHLDAVRDSLPDNPPPSIVTMVVRRSMQPWGMVNDIDPIEDREAIGLMKRGIDLRDTGDFNEAIDCFRQSRTMRPKLYTSWNNEAMCLWLLGRFQEAVRLQEEGLSHSADCNAYGWAQLALMHHLLRNDMERDRCMLKARDIRPLSGDAAVKVCEALARAGRHRDLLDYALGSGFSDTPEVSFFAGIAAANCGFRDRAVALLKAAGEGVPDAPLAKQVMADIRSGKRENVSPRGVWPYFWHEQILLSERTDPSHELPDRKEQATFEKAARSSQNTSPGSKLWEEARETFKAIHKRHPEFYRAEFNYASMLSIEGKRKQAVRIVEKIALEHPEYPFAQAALVNLALDAGDTESAGFLIEDYRVPLLMHPLAFRAWLLAKLRYWKAVGSDVKALNTEEALRQLEETFGV